MRSLWLDYQRDDPERRRPGNGLLMIGTTVAVLVAVDYLAVVAERDDMRAQVEALARGVPQATVPAAGAGDEAVRAAAPPSAQRWEALFASLENAAGDSVTLLALQPGGREVQIGGEARDFAASLDYLQRLQASPALANARLTQSEVVAGNPQRPVRFGLLADWRGAP